MDPLLTKKHEEFRQEVRDFAEKEIKPVAAALDEAAEFSPELIGKMFDRRLPAAGKSRSVWRNGHGHTLLHRCGGRDCTD